MVTDSSEADVVVVTGAGGALGTAVVDEFRRRGACVIAVDRSTSALAGVDPDVRRHVCDLADADAVEDLFDHICVEHRAPAAVVHTVGAFHDGSLVDSTPDDVATLFDVNLMAAWWVSRAAARRMQSAGGGAIVHVGARHGVDVVGGAAAYGVSKA